MRKELLAAALVLLVVAAALPARGERETIEVIGRASVRAPAVARTDRGYEGAVIGISVAVARGRGDVYVSTNTLTEVDMQASARVAAMVAADALGMNYTDFDYFFRVEADSIIVGGPSAGAVMVVGVVAALTGWEMNESVYMTGAINPDGSIGPVGGIVEKLEAAASEGAKLFLIPLGQRIVVRYVVEVERIGPFEYRYTKPVKIDVVEYGEKLGVKVVEVADVYDVIRYFFGKEIEQPELPAPGIPGEVADALRELARELADLARARLEEVEEELSAARLPSQLAGELEDLLESEARARLAEAEEAIEERPYYAASLALQSLALSQYAAYFIAYREGGERAVEEDVYSEIERARAALNASVPDSLEDLEFLLASEYRLSEAEDLARRALEAESLRDFLYWMSLAKWRAYTSRL